MHCRNCGNTIGAPIDSCPICGQNPMEGSNYCPNCGHFCIPGDTVCVECKQSLTGNPSLKVTIKAQNAPMSDVPPIPNITSSDVPPIPDVSQSEMPPIPDVAASEVPPIPQVSTQPPSFNSTGKAQYSQSGPKFLADGKKYCRQCGLVINSDAQMCPFCESVANSGSSYCPKCGTGTTEADSVCSVCTTSLTRIQTSYIPSQPPSVTVPPRNNNAGYQRPAAPSNSGYSQQQRNAGTINIQNNYYGNGQYPNADDEAKDFTTALILCLLGAVGLNGLHRFYTGHIIIGLLQLLSGGVCWIWQIIDLIMILTGSYTDEYGRRLKR